MEVSWLRIKSGLELQNYRGSTGQMLVLDTGGRLDIKDQVGTGAAVMQNNASIYPNTIGIGTGNPGINVGGGSYDITGEVFEIENTSGNVNIILDGNIPNLILADRAGAANDKMMAYRVDAGAAYFTSLTDAGVARVANIISMDMGNGNVTTANDVTVGGYLYVGDQRIYIGSGGAGYEWMVWYDGTDIYFGAFNNVASDVHIYSGAGDTIYFEDNNTSFAEMSDTNITLRRDVLLAATYDLDCNTYGAYLKPRRIKQSAQPTPDSYELCVHHDQDDDKHYLVYRDPTVGAGTTYQVEMV